MHSLRRLRSLKPKVWRSISHSSVLRQTIAAPLEIPQPEGEQTTSPKIEKLVSEITQLTLLEVAELSGVLKRRLNLPDAPMMAMGAVPQAAAQPEEEEEVVQEKQVLFKVKLVKFDEKQKVALIKEVKSLLEGMNLVQAKKFVESAPTVVKSDLSKEEAEKLKEALTKVGAEIAVE